jgi:hypothetical protein
VASSEPKAKRCGNCAHWREIDRRGQCKYGEWDVVAEHIWSRESDTKCDKWEGEAMHRTIEEWECDVCHKTEQVSEPAVWGDRWPVGWFLISLSDSSRADRTACSEACAINAIKGLAVINGQ